MIACINNANYTVLKLQMAINEMMLSFKELYSLDESYERVITEKETAASFASKSMEAGIPSKPLKQSETPIPFLRNIGKGGGSQAASINGFSAKNSRCFGEDKDIDFY